MTAMTAAGVQPIGSVFSAVPAAAVLLGRDTMPQFPPSRARSAPARHLENRDLTPGLCGCTAEAAIPACIPNEYRLYIGYDADRTRVIPAF